MIKYPFILRKDSLEFLSGLIGDRWDYWGSSSKNPLPDRALVRMFVRTDANFLGVSIVNSEPGAFPDDPDVTMLSIDHNNWDESKARRNGGIFFHDRNKYVSNVRLIREREVITFLDGSETINDFDIGLIFEFGQGVISFHRVNCYDVEFDIRRADSLSALDLALGAPRFLESLEYRTSVSRSIPSASTLLNAVR